MLLRLVPVLLLFGTAAAYDLPSPSISGATPLGGQRGATHTVELQGNYLSNVQRVDFDCDDLIWVETLHSSSGRLSGKVSVAAGAPLGPHILRVWTLDGYSTAAMFNVGQFGDIAEVEPNDSLKDAHRVEGPAEVQGALNPSQDIDVFAIQASAGERWSFDLRSIKYGSSLECKMSLLDADGRRIAYNDDRDDYDETPFIEHVFDEAGTYFVILDQYRGPRGFRLGTDASYALRISKLPSLQYAAPLGARVGTTTKIRLGGSALASIEGVYLTEVRAAEYARMTYPYTMPIRIGEDPPTAADLARIDGKVLERSSEGVTAEFEVPGDARTGLWKLWAAGTEGIADGPLIELTGLPEYTEANAREGDWRQGPYVINGGLGGEHEKDTYEILGAAGEPLHVWALATQLGIPHLDPVIILRDESGKKLAENDDTVGAYGTLIGNPDSTLFYTPKKNQLLKLTVEDRTMRGGPSYQYRLHVANEKPAFQLFTTPENFSVARGGAAEITVYMAREQGFDAEATMWFGAMPAGIETPRGKFRADQTFEPNADGADMIIPQIKFRIEVPESVEAGVYPIRVFGVATADELAPDRRVIEANTNLMMGPLLDLWNWVRRPLPEITMTVVEPTDVQLSLESRSLSVQRGAAVELKLKAVHLPDSSQVVARDLPAEVSYRVAGREGEQITLQIEVAAGARLGPSKFSVESKVDGRWMSAGLVQLVIKEAEAVESASR
jgi:hypothetical protein